MRVFSLNLGGGSGGASSAFTIMQPITGTAPTASSSSDTLTFSSSDNNISIAGNSATKTLNFTLANGLTFSGGTSTTIARSGKANIKITDSDSYLAVPGFEFYGGAAGATLLGVWDASQFALTGNLIFVANGTYDIGSGGFNPRNITCTGTITTSNYIKAIGPLWSAGIAYTTQATNFTIAGNVTYQIVDPGSTTASQTITMPASGGLADGFVLTLSIGANGITALTVNANTSQTLVGGGSLGSATATSFAWIWRSSNSTWYRA